MSGWRPDRCKARPLRGIYVIANSDIPIFDARRIRRIDADAWADDDMNQDIYGDAWLA